MLGLERGQGLRVERLQQYRQIVAGERLEHGGGQARLRGGLFQLGIDADAPPGGAVQAVHQLQHRAQARHAERPVREPALECVLHAQPRDFLPGEVGDVVVAVLPRPTRKFRGDVGDPVQDHVVQRDGHTVRGQRHVGLDPLRALPVAQRVRRQRVLRQVAGRAAVRDDLDAAGAGRRGREEQAQAGQRPSESARGHSAPPAEAHAKSDRQIRAARFASSCCRFASRSGVHSAGASACSSRVI